MKPAKPPSSPHLARGLACAALTVCVGAASAHDTWFHRLPAPAGDVRLALGTGNRFPVQEFAVGAEHLARHGCASAGGPAKPLAVQDSTPTALLLRAQGAPGALSCWAQLLPHEIELPPDKVRVYLDEIQAPAAVRAAWAAMQAGGLPWRERYTKHARIELPGPTPPAARPSGMDMDMLLRAPAAIRVGDEIQVQVLRDGRPCPAFAVQMRSELSPVGVWQLTDADGRLRLRPPLQGRWVLRGTALTPPQAEGGPWESQFLTLAFDVAPALPQASR